MRGLLSVAVHRRHQPPGFAGHSLRRVPGAEARLHPERRASGRLREPRGRGHRQVRGRRQRRGRHPRRRGRHLVCHPLPDVQRGPCQGEVRGWPIDSRVPLLWLHSLRRRDGDEAGRLLRVRLQGLHRPRALLRHVGRGRRTDPVVRLPGPPSGHEEGRRLLGGRRRLGAGGRGRHLVPQVLAPRLVERGLPGAGRHPGRIRGAAGLVRQVARVLQVLGGRQRRPRRRRGAPDDAEPGAGRMPGDRGRVRAHEVHLREVHLLGGARAQGRQRGAGRLLQEQSPAGGRHFAAEPAGVRPHHQRF
mmetsp:Transcript_84230/g.257218  ORF Transcript_84230/g.257218 Transcript_84230/m.257218 type:complete len:303 (-) Transcript_84230:682-1590(-)